MGILIFVRNSHVNGGVSYRDVQLPCDFLNVSGDGTLFHRKGRYILAIPWKLELLAVV